MSLEEKRKSTMESMEGTLEGTFIIPIFNVLQRVAGKAMPIFIPIFRWLPRKSD